MMKKGIWQESNESCIQTRSQSDWIGRDSWNERAANVCDSANWRRTRKQKRNKYWRGQIDWQLTRGCLFHHTNKPISFVVALHSIVPIPQMLKVNSIARWMVVCRCFGWSQFHTIDSVSFRRHSQEPHMKQMSCFRCSNTAAAMTMMSSTGDDDDDDNSKTFHVQISMRFQRIIKCCITVASRTALIVSKNRNRRSETQ